MTRAYYSDSIAAFLQRTEEEIVGILVSSSEYPIELSQRDAWAEEIRILKAVLKPYQNSGRIYFEYSVPRLGKRIDVILVIASVIFILEFKVGSDDFSRSAIDQVCDYGLDLKNFHETSHDKLVAPILIATHSKSASATLFPTPPRDGLLLPLTANSDTLGAVMADILRLAGGSSIDAKLWESGRYCPTPTIIEAAMALYGGHSVAEISRSDAGATNLTETSDAVSKIIRVAKEKSQKAICFVTGVPGAGKTLVGLNIATTHIDKNSDLYSVFLSGNGPLVQILREALARDKVRREKERGKKVRLGKARSEVKLFIQNVHNFRDECLLDETRPPIEHVALFDEAQRAWNKKQTANFMKRKRKKPNFEHSEPEFLISCLNRHPDWAVVVCLVGGGQEINTGEAGIAEWIESLIHSFPDWQIYISSRLHDSEYAAGGALQNLKERRNVVFTDELHLGVSMRSFRAENVSALVKQLLDLDEDQSRHTLHELVNRYPIVITRELAAAKQWLKEHARGSERYGIVVSSEAQRLKPHAIDVKSPMDPVHWFLDGKEDVRSSYYLEDVATEFHVQGLELDWACVTWDADFRYTSRGWEHWSFCGDRWNRINSQERRKYLKNSYRVLLTRARQGMVIVVPNGEPSDHTRRGEFYDPTFDYLSRIGFKVI